MVILIFIIILAVLILSHELGHFSAAKFFGIRVDEFGFGFPPKIFSFKKGETVYSINLLPLGGFVKIFGEDATDEIIKNKPEDFKRSLYHKPRYIQMVVVVAGVVFNIILAWLALSLGFMNGLPVPADFAPLGSKVQDVKLLITEVLPGSPAELAGLLPGDNILSLTNGGNSILVISPSDVSNFIASHNGEKIFVGYKIPVKRGALVNIGLGPLDYGAEIKTAEVTPRQGVIGNQPGIGIAMDQVGILKLPFFTSLYAGLIGTSSLFVSTALGLFNFIVGFFAGQSSAASVSGPIGLIGIVGSAAQSGFSYILALVALISVNLAVLNLVPFPALDGGRLFFLLIESVMRRPLNVKVVNSLNIVGFFFLLGLMLVVTYGDILKLTS